MNSIYVHSFQIFNKGNIRINVPEGSADRKSVESTVEVDEKVQKVKVSLSSIQDKTGTFLQAAKIFVDASTSLLTSFFWCIFSIAQVKFSGSEDYRRHGANDLNHEITEVFNAFEAVRGCGLIIISLLRKSGEFELSFYNLRDYDSAGVERKDRIVKKIVGNNIEEAKFALTSKLV